MIIDFHHSIICFGFFNILINNLTNEFTCQRSLIITSRIFEILFDTLVLWRHGYYHFFGYYETKLKRFVGYCLTIKKIDFFPQNCTLSLKALDTFFWQHQLMLSAKICDVRKMIGRFNNLGQFHIRFFSSKKTFYFRMKILNFEKDKVFWKVSIFQLFFNWAD